MSEFKRQFDSIELIPGEQGRFEVRIDDVVIFDIKQAGRLPDPDEIKAEIGKRLSQQV